VWRTESIWDLSVSAATSPAANADHTSDLVSGQRTRALRVRAVRRMCAFVSTIVWIGFDMRSACEAYRPATSAEWDTPLMSFMCNAVKECASLIHEFSTASVGRFVR
jgi:hypothetical protein